MPLEIRSFHVAMGFFFATIVAVLVEAVTVMLPVPFYVVTGFTVLSVVAAYGFAVRTGRYNLCAFGISLLLNLLELPLAYFIDGRMISSALIYYSLAFYFIMFNISGIYRIISLFCFFLSYILSVTGMYLLHRDYTGFRKEPFSIVSDVLVPLLICVAYACVSVLFRMRMYEEEIRTAEDERIRAEKADQSKDVFMMNMSHEMRTPMNAVMSAAGLIYDKDVAPEVKRHVGYVRNACENLISTVDDLLVFSEMEGDKMEFVREEYDLEALLEEIVNMISVRLMETEVAFYVHIDPMLPKTLFGDGQKLRQLFINILNNAVKYTVAGYVELNVSVKKILGDELTLMAQVSDTGIGIREEEIPRLFQAFERVDDKLHDTIRIEGSGLGLSISRTIAEGMGGGITVESEYNRGSTFSFEVRQQIIDAQPLSAIRDTASLSVLLFEEEGKRADSLERAFRECGVDCLTARNDVAFRNHCRNERFTHIFISLDHYIEFRGILAELKGRIVVLQDIDQTMVLEPHMERMLRPVSCLTLARYFNHKDSKAGAGNGSKLRFRCPDARVLVIDDNKTNLFVAQGLLGRYGMSVVTAVSGSEALNLLDERGFDMVFIDYMMPEMDGIDTLKAIRSCSYSWVAEVPCVVLTADAAEGAKQMLMTAGFDDYISKPIQVDQLTSTIRRLIDPDLIKRLD